MSSRSSLKKENQTLVALAVKSRLIEENKGQEILSRIIEKSQADQECSVVDIFINEKILSNEEIKFLFALQKHLKIKMLDKKFGELGVVNRFVTPQSVQDALELQDSYFRTNKKSKKIGDILVEKKELSHANKTAILLTQNRIQDHLLEQAINDIGSSEIEKIRINMRFGAIAVKKGLITIDQLNDALKIQKSEVRSGKRKRYLGEIFKELYALSDKDILAILKVQKEIEKKRLSLEKALNRYNSEITTIKRLNALFEVIFSKDRMEAYLHRKKESFEKIEIAHVHNWLKLNGIKFGVIGNALIESFVSESEIGSSLKIARGKPCQPPTDEVVTFFFDTGSASDSQAVPEKNECLVKAGDVLAEISPHKDAVPGTNVLGHAITGPAPKMVSLICGEGVIRKNFACIAQTDGRPVLIQQRSLFVEPVVTERKDCNFVGTISENRQREFCDTNLTLEGSITDKGELSCHDAVIYGDIFGTVTCTGDLDVKGRIGHEETLHTKIQSSGEIKASKRIVNAQISTAKGLTAPKSDVFNSEIYAMQHIVLNAVHSTADNPSILQIGSNRNLRLNALNQAIDEKTDLLRTLTMQDKQDALSLTLQKKITIQTELLEKQNILGYLLSAIHSETVKHIHDLEQKIQVFEPSDANGQKIVPDPSGRSGQDRPEGFMEEVLDLLKEMPEKDQISWLKEKSTQISDFYKSAVEETEKYKTEYKIKIEMIQRKVKKRESEISAVKQEIDHLMAEKDYCQFQAGKQTFFDAPAIRVKNIVEAHTIVKGKKAFMTVENSMFSVKFKEVADPRTNAYKIEIDGYYS